LFTTNEEIDEEAVLAYQMRGGAHPLLQGGPPGTWLHHKPETSQTNHEPDQTKSDLSLPY
jgi:hypothetical protein